ncbi:cysteine and histidine-rich domain-containing protein [Glossina fuscipes]|uniref:Cysteine and histidine-rich domain-containing protein n=1 Tax=Glossina fuscipes TaxID=7396 RepID=A0A9C5ZD95_9MUSC|nr:cysteine and histidine-rich domain-containing protein [Glossina fuscipes]
MGDKMLRCYNRGCGQEYDPEKNFSDSCRHHPGAPFFHDAYKGWSCCNKKSVDFTEFLSIKGCTVSKHSNIKPPEPEKPVAVENEENEKTEEKIAPIRALMERPPLETAMTEIQPEVAAALKDTIDNLKTKSATLECEADANELTVGTACKNSGCNYCFSDSATDGNRCRYHPGVPIFHEGMKYWSCCQRKTSDFAVFMAQPGCKYGQHKWFKDNSDKKVVQCRYDWHQTPTSVIVSIYAKKYHYAHSKIKVNPVRLQTVLIFSDQENANFELDLELRGIIDVSKTTAHMFASKVEIKMVKAEPGSWSRLDLPQQKVQPVRKINDKNPDKSNSTSDADFECFSLDDIETVNQGLHLSEMSTTKVNLD